MQGEQEKHIIWFDLPELLPDPQSFQVADFSVAEFDGSRNPCSNQFTDRRNLCETGAAVPGDTGGLGNQEKIMTRLRLDSTSAQAFFSRLGPGKAKHLSTRLLWTQQAMRRLWFHIDRISAKESPADLNTKPLSKERREFLMKRIGLQSNNFEVEEDMPQNNRKKQLVKLLVNMVMKQKKNIHWTWTMKRRLLKTM